uniref:Uncharacterized protein n=1 Tax=Arundo donax TaxID=35708 RepID=A0A0A9AC18_ARUDO
MRHATPTHHSPEYRPLHSRERERELKLHYLWASIRAR